MISVIIPTYNSASTIRRCLESLANQSDMNFEVVVVDDCSEDYLVVQRIIEEFSKSLKISFFHLTKKGNGAIARNFGIQKVKTSYICFLDSDDFWVNNRIELAYNSIQKTRYKELCEYSRYRILHSGYVSPTRELRPGELVSEYVFFSDMSMQTSTFLISTEIAKSVLFDENLSRHQDSTFMMRAQSMGYPISFKSAITNNYVISESDIKERVISGRITPEFCNDFLVSYGNYFSKKAELGYLFNVYLRIAILSKRKVVKVVFKLIRTGEFYKLMWLTYFKLKKRIDHL